MMSNIPDKPEIHEQLLGALGEDVGEVALPTEVPFEFTFRSRLVRAYCFNLGRSTTAVRGDEYKIVLRAPGQERHERSNFDFSGDASVLLVGYNAALDVFAFWQAGFHLDFSEASNVQVRGDVVERAVENGWCEQTRKLTSTGVQETVLVAGATVLRSRFAEILSLADQSCEFARDALAQSQPPAGGDWDYPIDTLLIRQESRTVFEVIRRVRRGSYVMDPDFQRDFIWPEDKQSKLIESVLMRIPLPVFYLAEDKAGRMVVVDGLQRLTTFVRFFDDELRLKLPQRDELHRKRFSELSAKLQNRIEDCNLILYIIDAKVPERARLDIFERVNGGVPLSRQQMRNCLYMGPATRFLKTAAKSKLFVEVTGRSLDPKTMRDREFVNRFCAFDLLGFDTYRGDMDQFLADVLVRMNDDSSVLVPLEQRLRTALKNNQIVFGKHAFRKHVPGQEYRSVVNASLWDVMATGLGVVPEGSLTESVIHVLRSRFFELMEDEDFVKSITYGPNAVKQVQHRFTTVRTLLEEVIDDY